jgi:hypothetical protein
MGLYNFQPRFVPYILEGTKTHTIRAERRHMDMPGRTMHLYTGLRHKGARLLMRVRCVKIEFVKFETDGRVRIGARIDGYDPKDSGGAGVPGGFLELDEDEKIALAWRDGFRFPETWRKRDRHGVSCFDLMLEFWRERLPWSGWIIHWQPPATCFPNAKPEEWLIRQGHEDAIIESAFEAVEARA